MSELLQGIASITKTVQQTLNSYEVRKLGDKVQGYVMNFTETEQKVREATNEDPWGPTGPQMQEIASFTFQYDLFSEVMGILWKRMFQENKLAWRRVYKSLVLLNHLLKNGSERVISTARDHMFELRTLESYKCLDERGKDEGLNVRHRVKLIMELLNDEDLLRAERRKAKTEGREKYQGFSKDDMLGGGRGSSSKFDSFERWNVKKTDTNKSVDFNRGDSNNGGERANNGGGRREVTAFDFDTEESRQHANGSPELGIREVQKAKRTPEANDADVEEDEFGDFTSARANSAAVPTASSALSSIQPPPAAATIKPLSSPPTAIKHASLTPPRAQSSAGGELDLLGLGADVFSNNVPAAFAPAQSAPNMVARNQGATPFQVAAQPVKSQSNNILDDIFSSPPPPPPTTATMAHNNSGATSNDFMDLLSSGNSTLSKNDKSPPVDLLGGEFVGFVTNEPKNANVISDLQINRQQQQPKTATESDSSRPTLGNTWQELKGKVNIDFENLSLKPSPSKPTPSLNELKMKSSSKGGSNPAKSSAGDFIF